MRINFVKPNSLIEALEALKAAKASVIAGGTDLMVEIRGGRADIENIVDISNIKELKGISIKDGKVEILAGTTHSEVVENELVESHIPILSKACLSIGSTLIRNRGTIGGNVANNASCADTIPVLLVLDSSVTLKSAVGDREVRLQDFLGRCGTVNKKDGELLYSINTTPLQGYKWEFIKVGRRKALAISRLTLAIALKENNGVIEDLRICPGAVLGKPTRLYYTEKKFKGEVLKDCIKAVADSAVNEVITLSGKRWSSEYKEPVLNGLIIRTLEGWCE